MSEKQVLRPYRLHVERLDGTTEEVLRVALSPSIAEKITLANQHRLRVLSCHELTADEYRAARAAYVKPMQRHLTAESRRIRERRDAGKQAPR